jgi:hypothetical protein
VSERRQKRVKSPWSVDWYIPWDLAIMTLQGNFPPRNSTLRRERSTVEDLGMRATDVLDYEEFDSVE